MDHELVGGHGAGLTNMLFAPSDAVIIEFGLNPHVDRCFGHMAMSLGLEYWLVPQVSSIYHLRYGMTPAKAALVARLMKHVMKSKGLEHLMVQDVVNDEL